MSRKRDPRKDRARKRRRRRRQDANDCSIVGHLPLEQGVWPEDQECPRCGYTETTIGFSVEVIRRG